MLFELIKRNADSPNVVAHPPVIFAAGFLIGLACNFWAGISFNIGEMVKIGWVFVAGGVAIAAWAALQLSAAGTGVPTNLPTTAIVTTGPYVFSRNPIYIGLILAHLGLASVLDAPLAMAALIVIIPVMHKGVVMREEAYLEAKFGPTYRSYLARTKRYF
jgi:protein-S-isoprenylcysteine O-methyltransferase Ste14